MAIEITTTTGDALAIVCILIIAGIIALLLFFIWIFSIFHCLFSRKLTLPQKLFWLLIIILFNILGTLLYVIFSRIGGKPMAKKAQKGKKLLRSKDNRIIAGVCAGIGDYMGVDPTVIRLIWILLIFFSFGAALLAYLIAWIIIPEK